MKYNNFKRLVVVSLILVYLIILAGAVVRMTGSGMGCPDWPKCFGHLFPPLSKQEVAWKTNHNFFKGQMILHEGYLWVAKKKITTNKVWNQENWKKFDKHNYTTYNPTHTIVEYINRLFSVLAGIPILLMSIISLKFLKTKKIIFWYSMTILFTFCFQAWLGKVLVDTALHSTSITIHLFVALLIIVLFIFLLHNIYPVKSNIKLSSLNNKLFLLLLFGLILQFGLGTQIRQQVDEAIINLGYDNKKNWLSEVNWIFILHRSFSIILLIGFIYLFSSIWKFIFFRVEIIGIFSCLIVIMLTGILMNYFEFPFGSQAAHLFLSSVLFGLVLWVFLRYQTFAKGASQN